ncbi:hypothetical protein BV20DRAFT_161181 [Pilatotrama ljubarskyi]|nr:hypothetical protein BV20DRAFT_161181 [Pilatotrama ljubarskyi]
MYSDQVFLCPIQLLVLLLLAVYRARREVTLPHPISVEAIHHAHILAPRHPQMVEVMPATSGVRVPRRAVTCRRCALQGSSRAVRGSPLGAWCYYPCPGCSAGLKERIAARRSRAGFAVIWSASDDPPARTTLLSHCSWHCTSRYCWYCSNYY